MTLPTCQFDCATHSPSCPLGKAPVDCSPVDTGDYFQVASVWKSQSHWNDQTKLVHVKISHAKTYSKIKGVTSHPQALLHLIQLNCRLRILSS